VITLKPQEIPLNDPESCHFFVPVLNKPFSATPAALSLYGEETIRSCLQQLQATAQEHGGLDYLQVFTDPDRSEALWFMEGGPGGAITALLPSDH
jgi:hypothetical protein